MQSKCLFRILFHSSAKKIFRKGINPNQEGLKRIPGRRVLPRAALRGIISNPTKYLGGGSLFVVLGRDFVSSHLVVQGSLTNVQLLYCMGNITAVFFKNVGDNILLNIGDDVFQGVAIEFL